MSNGPWTCFHCHQTFANPTLARAHFGALPSATPACVLKSEQGLVYALREAEAARDELQVRLNAARLGEDEDNAARRWQKFVDEGED